MSGRAMTLRPEQLADLLALAPAGMTTAELGARLLRRGAGGRDADIARALDDMRRAGRVTIGPDRRWRLTGRAPTPATPPPGGPAVVGMSAAPARFSLAPPEPADAAGPAAAEGAPPPIRDLLRYYEQTLRRDARGAVAQNPEDHGARFLLFAGEGAWFPETERASHLRIPRAALPDAFREALARSGAAITLCVGWPLQVFAERGETILAPALTLTAEARLDEAGLSVTIPPEETALNVEWLRRTAKLSHLGAEALTDRLYGGEPSLHAAALADFGRRAGDLLARGVAGPLDPARLATGLSVGEPKLCNAAALFLPSDTPYTKAAADDLAWLAQLPEAALEATALGPVLRDDARPRGAPRRLIPAAALTENQFEAAASALTEPLTVITGPPRHGQEPGHPRGDRVGHRVGHVGAVRKPQPSGHRRGRGAAGRDLRRAGRHDARSRRRRRAGPELHGRRQGDRGGRLGAGAGRVGGAGEARRARRPARRGAGAGGAAAVAEPRPLRAGGSPGGAGPRPAGDGGRGPRAGDAGAAAGVAAREAAPTRGGGSARPRRNPRRARGRRRAVAGRPRRAPRAGDRRRGGEPRR